MNYKHEHTPAVRRLLSEQGAQGYGLYWLLREEVETQGGAVDLSFLPVIAAEAKADPIKVQAVALDYGLFRVEGETIRDIDLDAQRQRAKDAAAARWKKPPTRQRQRPRPAPKNTEPTDAAGQPPAVVEENQRFAAFQEWARVNTPYIADPKHLTQLTAAEFEKLISAYGSEAIAQTMRDLENRKDKRRQYVNLYRTLLNWLKNGNRKSNRERTAPMDAAKRAIVERMQCSIDGQG